MVSLACALVLGQAVTSPAPGSTTRKALMDALRAVTKKSLKSKPVVFKVEFLKLQGNWAFMHGKPVKPNGSAFDYKGTVYQDAIKADMFADWVCALYVKKGSKWTVREWCIGATDVVWIDWAERFKAPKAIFPDVGGSFVR